MRRRIACYLIAAFPLTIASCVHSLHPLSNEETSELDQRLFGTWQRVKGLNWGDVITVGKKQGTKNTHEVVVVELNEDKTAKVERMTVYSRQGKIALLSIELEGTDGKEKRKGYAICKYELPDANTLRLNFPDPQVVGEAVFRGELRGKGQSISGSGPGPETITEIKDGKEKDGKENVSVKPDASSDESKEPGIYDIVALTDPPAKIVSYFEQNAAKCFNNDEYKVVYKRIGEPVESSLRGRQ